MILYVEEEHIHNHVQDKPGHWEGAAQVRGLCLASSVKGCEGKSSRATVVHKQLKLMGKNVTLAAATLDDLEKRVSRCPSPIVIGPVLLPLPTQSGQWHVDIADVCLPWIRVTVLEASRTTRGIPRNPAPVREEERDLLMKPPMTITILIKGCFACL